ncbi:substrate-binding domain-containing protein [Dyella silvatica]|uniref:substrate-binding domain-containing protein n=1 Tax=Dyella silvatica TaxID=2992128 RepID=UPI00225A85D8|nr:substrate-binding domain-containing protein [Dyella silvatica]
MTCEYLSKVRLNTLIAAVLLGMSALTSMAHAGSTLVGGGATLPALGFVGDVTHRQQIAPIFPSLFGVFSAQLGNPSISYCMNGSGMGKKLLEGVSSSSVQAPCADGSVDPTGFGATVVNRGDLKQPNFIASDSPLTVSDYDNYQAHRVGSLPVQFPAVASSIAITFNVANLQALNLTDADLCKIFSGQITDWSDLPSGAWGPIQVVYDSDDSGTTFALSNHLAAICSGTPTQHFIADPSFKKVVSLYFPGVAGKPTFPSTWIAQSGDQNVVNTVVNTNGTLAYAGVADVLNAAASWATIDTLDPIADFADPATGRFTINASDLVYNQLINGADATTGQPVLSPAPPTTPCIALVKPQAYAYPTFPPTTYPLVAISYLMANTASNGSDLINVRNLLAAPYNASITYSVGLTTIGVNTGMAFLNTNITPSQVAGCIVN